MTREALPDEGERAHLDILRNAYSVRIDLANRKWGRFSGRTGVDVRFTDQKSRGIGEPLVPSGNILEGGIYMYQQLDFDQLNINVGGRMDLRNQDTEPNTALNLPDTNETKDVLEQSYFTWSGSFGANYRLNERFSVSTNLSRGFRAAGFFDLHVDGLHGGIAAYQRGNPFLNPEISWNTDLSLKYRSDRLQFKATGYRNLIDDYIFLINTGEFSDQGPPVLRNIQTKALLYGGHMEVNAELIPGWKISLYGELVRGENRDDDLENVDELPLLPSDEIGGKLEWNQEEIGLFHSIYASVKVSYNFSKEAAGRYEPFWQFGSNFPFGVASTDPYTLIQLKAGLEFPFYERKIALDLWVDNLFDVSYRNFLDTYKGYALSPGRNIGLKLEIPFLSIHKPKKEE